MNEVILCHILPYHHDIMLENTFCHVSIKADHQIIDVDDLVWDYLIWAVWRPVSPQDDGEK